MTPNQSAFLSMISHSEGTDRYPDQGYKTIVGGEQFESYDDHPHKVVHLNPRLSSSAAGRYQLLARYFDIYKKQLNLPDFSPDSQDAIALQQIKERGALDNIAFGEIAEAIEKCSNIWASFPGAPYGQHTNHLADLLTNYESHGGTLKEA